MSLRADRRARGAAWRHRGSKRPAFAEIPGPGQESVWDYPRPPVLRPDDRLVEVGAGPVRLATTRRALRVLETASPPAFYVPREDVAMALLLPSSTRTWCEWKGEASYFKLSGGRCADVDVAWTYLHPLSGFEPIAGYLAFYPEHLDCFVDGERVRAQGGGYYGGWVTNGIVGPFKGQPGTAGW